MGRKPRREFSEEKKREAVDDYVSGRKSAEQVAAEVGVDRQSSLRCQKNLAPTTLGTMAVGLIFERRPSIHHGNKKMIFVKPIDPRAQGILGGVCTHPVFFNNSYSFRRQPMIDTNLIPLFDPDGLIEFASKVPDGRSRHGRRHRTVGMMILCLCKYVGGKDV